MRKISSDGGSDMYFYLVSVSGGAGSTLALERAIEKHSSENVGAVFADTNTEDESLYALLNEIRARHAIEFEWLNYEREKTIWDCFDEHGIIRTPTGACKASIELKQKPIARFVRDHYFDYESVIIVSGLEYAEPERRERFDEKWKPYKCWHPLADPPILSACQIQDEVKRLGYPKQTLYERRYPHNNCGGGCILAGLGQWHGLYIDKPELFEWHKDREIAFNARRKDKKPYTILRDQSGDTVRSLTLEDFEQRILSNSIDLRDFRSTCGCFLGTQGNLFELLDP